MPAQNTAASLSAERAAALKVQGEASNLLADGPTSIVDLFAQPKATNDNGSPKTTAELLSSDQQSLTKIRTDLAKQQDDLKTKSSTKGQTATTDKTAATGKSNTSTSSVPAYVQAAYADNGPDASSKAA